MPSLEKETSVSPEKICCKNTKIWLIRLMLLGITLVSYQFFSILQSLEDSSTSPSIYGTACNSFRLWDSLRLNVSRNTRLFLRLKQLFWMDSSPSLPLPYGINGSEDILRDIFSVLPYDDIPEHLESSKCRTCVVIGNGFIIKNTSLGNTINQYDVVIRINDGPVRGFEKDVGNKTTMRFFYPESAVSDPNVHNEPDTLMVLVPFKLVDLIWLRDILYNKKRIVQLGFWKPPPRTWLGRSSQFRILDPFFMHHTASDLLGTPFNPDKPVCPTSGMLAVYVALNFCSVVHLAGFGYPSDKNDLIHYFGRDTMDFMINSEHNVTHEAQVLKRLEDHGVIQFLHPH
ncbi:CMP-N-acetylneuraminate-beta-galactosamide-alpha-2,3-sialyltransferase 4-like isoform X1 [Brienomyrus brachyistius]|uniref:CMP-N-acetylneuraminate-beta-galactosamide- alpha-2,3-sialyltransferase 4-like isoform X1 n=1 Tax=Brienomyrus brachyistius TaxID=42636 RepID=UPI0020B1C011|nr:CMP-N-acetylneuraminate-beta-galactosamide-alpha-2,3-sialyltransferase 4-like isoform X1 [Brienomyrus brachyistius]XP_048861221.1 CMP-N-acetylneuraminate-beta-galactosamide-alpha-2,3-sialyltransferase 4-like isoform X1 [Brienomyrus brachyistius]XP_048861222.1 CMP-N-acetylneuraminate-beta-galactosamide-alpha-2,3-sialyltransferase 4-like isoform X1 [Brienomyrus brachyistius]